MYPTDFESPQQGRPPFRGGFRKPNAPQFHWERHARQECGPAHHGRAHAPFAPWPQRFGPPWRRDDRQRGPRGGGPARFAAIRPHIGSLIALVHAAEPHQLEAVQSVLADARRRIAAILAEERPATPAQPVSTGKTALL